jgi:hypothetical protein
MTAAQILPYVASILMTAAETEPDIFPESMAYLAAGGMEEWNMIKRVMLHIQVITIEGNLIRLTPKGRDYAHRMNASVKAGTAPASVVAKVG